MTTGRWWSLFLVLIPSLVVVALGLAWRLRGRPRLRWFVAALAVIVANSWWAWKGMMSVVGGVTPFWESSPSIRPQVLIVAPFAIMAVFGVALWRSVRPSHSVIIAFVAVLVVNIVATWGTLDVPPDRSCLALEVPPSGCQ